MSSQIELNYIDDFQFCDRDHFQVVKGISVVVALISYLCGEFWNFPYLQFLQTMAAAVFLVCSGFGVSESFQHKGGLYHYWENKFIKIWIPSLLALIICSLIEKGNAIEWIGQYPVALKGNLLYLVFGNYLAFWLAFTFFNGKTARIVSIYILALVGFFCVELSLLRKLMFCFPVGVMASQLGWRREFRKLQWRGRLVTVLVSAAAAVLGWFLANAVQIPYLNELLWNVSCLGAAVFLLVGVYALHNIPIFGVFAPFGYMAYILYLVYKEGFRFASYPSDWRAVAAIVLGVFAVSLLGSWLMNRLVSLNKKYRRRKKTHLKGSMW